MARKRRKVSPKNKKAVISKEWKLKDGIVALPPTVRAAIDQTFDRLSVGQDMRDEKFFRKLRESERPAVAYELIQGGVSYKDISVLFGLTVAAIYGIAERARDQLVRGLGPTWFTGNFVDDYYTLKSDGAWNRAKSEGATDDATAGMFRRNAAQATAQGAKLLVNYAANEVIARAIREATQNENKTQPGASDRVAFMQWVFENSILQKKNLTSPVTEAEVVDGTTEKPNDLQDSQ
jgi:hypothetical protein